MSYFSQQMPTWENIGTEPPPDKRTRGWIVKDKPPAEWFNWLQNRTYACINEIRTVIDSLGTDELYNTLSSHMRDRINHTIYAVATGAVNTYIVSTSPAPTSYTDGMSISVKIPIANTGASTINWNGLGARPIVRFNGAAVSSGNLPANTIVSMRYSTTNSSFFLLGGSATGNATVSQVLSGRTFTNDEGEQIGTMANRGAITYTPTTTDFPIVEGYHSGSGKVVGDANLVGGNIKTGISIFGVMGTATQATGTATAAQVLAGYTFSSSSGSGLSGTMVNRGTVNYTPTTTSQTILQGYHSGSGTVAGDTNLIAANILAGKTIFGVSGAAINSVGTATAAQVLSGYTFSNSVNSGISGAMANRGSVTITPSASNQAITEGYHSGSGYVVGSSNLVAANIKSGINLFGITGTAPIPSGTATAAQVLTGYTFSNSTNVGLSGSMANRGTINYTPGTSNQAIGSGYHSGSGVVYGDSNLSPGNIRSGVSIFGVTGTVTPGSINIQNLEVLLPHASSSVTVSISPVNLGSSFILFNGAYYRTAGNFQDLAVYFSDSNNVTVRKYSAGGDDRTAYLQIVSFSPQTVGVQHINQPYNGYSGNVSINPVDPTRSMIIRNGYTFTTTAAMGTLSWYEDLMLYFASGTSVAWRRQSTTGNGTMYFSIAQFY